MVEQSAPARAIARLDPEKLLLVGAACFVVMSIFALSGLGGGSAEPTTVEAAEASTTSTAPEALAAVDSTVVEPAPAPTLPSRPPRSTMPPVSAPAEPMAMGLPAALLDGPQSQVYRLYRTALGREPDRDGFAFWADQIRADVPLERLAQEFLASDEYIEQFGGETGWDVRAELLIINAFGPPADGPQMVAWLDRFRGLDGADLLVAISEADETLAATGTLR